MKLFFQSLMIFFGTLFAAALVALGEPSQDASLSGSAQSAVPTTVAMWFGLR